MQSVQLYIGDTRIDLFEDETISLNQSIQNVRDISKVFTDFSQTFSVPASRNNNKLFKHYYNYHIDNGFDARKKASGKIELNSKKFRDGKIRLDGVNLKHGIPYAYKITFFGNTVNLKDLLSEDNLASLDWLNNFSLDYDGDTVLSALQNAGGLKTTIDGIDYKIIAPLITHTRRPIYDSNRPADEGSMNLYPSGTTLQGLPYDELKYGLPVKAIVKAIEESGYGIKFSSHFFNEENLHYSNLYMWLHRKKGKVFEGLEVTHQVKTFPTNLSELIGVACYPDRLLVFNSPQGVSYTLRIESDSTDPYTVIIKRDGQVFKSVTAEGGLILETSGVLTNSSTGYSVFIQTKSAITQLDAEWQITSIQYPESYTYVATAESVGLTQNFIITEQIPEMKIIDFLTGLFKMFNLTAYEKDGIIEVKTLDEYYSSSYNIDVSSTEISSDSTTITADTASEIKPLRDITNYIDVEAHTVDAALPFKEIVFEYKGLGTKLAENHNQTFNQGWGTGDYDGGGVFDAGGDTYKVIAPFEHMKYERLLDYDDITATTAQVGWFVDDNDDAYFGKPLLFYPVLINTLTIPETVTTIRFLTESGYYDIVQYNIPSNSLSIDSLESKDNINFNLELNEYTYSDDFTDTLFEKYYKTYITDVFNSKLRLSKYKAYFDLKFLLNYELSDKVQILDRIYRINSIVTNLQTGESDLELLNIGSADTNILVEGCTADITSIFADSTEVTADLACGVPIPLPTTTTTLATTTTTLPTTTTTTIATTTTTVATTTLAPTTTIATTTTCTPNGTLLGTYCAGQDLWGTYANGSCGTYTALIEANSPSCAVTTSTTTSAPCVQRITYSTIPQQNITVGGSFNINLDNFFTQLDGQPLSYSYFFISPLIESASINGSILTVNVNNNNQCALTGVSVTATDGISGNCDNTQNITINITGCVAATTTTTTITTIAPTVPTGTIQNIYIGSQNTTAQYEVFTLNAFQVYIDFTVNVTGGGTYSERQPISELNGQTAAWFISWDGDIDATAGGTVTAYLVATSQLNGPEYTLDSTTIILPDLSGGAEPCGSATSYQGGQAFPTEYQVNLGTGTGDVILDFNANQIPDKFIVVFDGVEVINTGYRGSTAYQGQLDAALSGRGLPSETIQGTGAGSTYFTKTTSTTNATIKVFAPLNNTAWTVTLNCPI